MRLSSTDGSGTTTYTYDLRDRLLTKAATAGTLTYTLRRRRQRRDDPLVERERHLRRLRLGRRQPARLRHRQPGRAGRRPPPTRRRSRPSTLAQPNGVGLTYSYDALDRVTSMLWRQGTSPAFGSWAYTHNERGQRTDARPTSPGRSAAYGYDAASRLDERDDHRRPARRRASTARSRTCSTAPATGCRARRRSPRSARSRSRYNANDELSGDTYDANGNTTELRRPHVRLRLREPPRLEGRRRRHARLRLRRQPRRQDRRRRDHALPRRRPQPDRLPPGARGGRRRRGADPVHVRDEPRQPDAQRRAATPATSYYGYDAHGNITFLTDASGRRDGLLRLRRVGELVVAARVDAEYAALRGRGVRLRPRADQPAGAAVQPDDRSLHYLGPRKRAICVAQSRCTAIYTLARMRLTLSIRADG